MQSVNSITGADTAMNESNSLASAHQAWDRRWQDEQTRENWRTPESLVVDSLPMFQRKDVRTAIDIGCGIGRHALFLSEHVFNVTGVDLSESGLNEARDVAVKAGLDIDYRPGDFVSLPVENGSYDLALAWNVIYHGDGDVVRTAISEVRRVLRPGGLFLGSMMSKRNDYFGKGTEIRPNTFVIEDEDEKSHAHFYCNDRELIDLLDGFQLVRLQDREQGRAGNWHWEFLAELSSTT
jgi:tellurite methyltransferase